MKFVLRSLGEKIRQDTAGRGFFFTKEHHAFKKDLSCGHSIHHQRELEGNKHFAFISTVLSELQPIRSTKCYFGDCMRFGLINAVSEIE